MTKYILIQEATDSWWKAMLQPTDLDLMAYIESHQNIEFQSFHYVKMTDELNVDGCFNGYEFNIFMEWGGDISLTFNVDVPEPIYSELEKHIKAYSYIGNSKIKSALARFEQLAKCSS
ncbi:hypothetical protein [Flocculibacter collagenilyticus]|uniref:hypothetical protein n=1 Tax=Flocculibacter collagenilyticus TaxID=2744479 RepID=UPI0018F6946D|nr:hypothetical protein [Flocculibacter collagenilyticus]